MPLALPNHYANLGNRKYTKYCRFPRRASYGFQYIIFEEEVFQAYCDDSVVVGFRLYIVSGDDYLFEGILCILQRSLLLLVFGGISNRPC
ncbi:MAG TPA: hypothetical protein DCO86_00175 [Spirochaetaceae bacterium]|nr:hypothetical protein [Spirochaetaceae bacterium]